MNDVTKVVVCIVGFVVFIIGISWISMGNEFMLYKYFAPKQEAVRTKVYRESQAQQDGMINELQKMQIEYASASPEGKLIIADAVVSRSAQFTGQLTPSLDAFVSKCKAQKGIN